MLSGVLRDLARVLTTDFPLQGILDHLVVRMVAVLPVTSVGVTLFSADAAPHHVAASDATALRVEQVQTALGEGPSIDAHRTSSRIALPDLGADARHPRFAGAALGAGIAAAFAFPLQHGDRRLGALTLYRDAPGALGGDDLAAASTLADVAAAYVGNATARDDARSASDRFHHSALHDPLTGLANRLLLHQRMAHAAQRALRSHANAAIFFADLDRFKEVNDTHGHGVGDALLQAVAERLAAVIRPGDTLARVSGDEFVLLCEDLESADDVEVIARRIHQAFAVPYAIGDVALQVTTSVGIAFAGPGVEISDGMIVDADLAMYQAKRGGGAAHRVIDLRTSLDAGSDKGLAIDLRAASTHHELDLAYQPIVRTRDGHVTGMEALLRWQHHDRGTIPALITIDVAERSGMIGELGSWVLERGCRDRARWLCDRPQEPLDLAVNVSARELMDPGFVASVTAVLARTGMDPEALILEVTESVFVEDVELALAAMASLTGLGIRLALDDFGSGYSSLSYLQRLPVQAVKIDRGFIAEIGRAPTGGAILAAVTNLAHVLGLAVIAEGVETERQHELVSAVGCEFAQGWFYARPLPASGVLASLLPASPAG